MIKAEQSDKEMYDHSELYSGLMFLLFLFHTLHFSVRIMEPLKLL